MQMAQLLARKLHFPCARRDSLRSLMAANTGGAPGGGPASRIVAFETGDEARAALRLARRGPLTLVIGPKLSYPIAAIGAAADAEVWNASALDVVSFGVTNFYLDVCTFPGDGSVLVASSFNVRVGWDGPAALQRLETTWNA